jgi:hypothetical protein
VVRVEHFLTSSVCLLVAGTAWLGMGVVEPPPAPRPSLATEPVDQPGLRQFVAACAAADTAAIPRLQELAGSPDPAVAGNAVAALGRLQAADRDPAVAALLRDDRARVRHEAIAALGNSADPDSARLLEPLLYGDDRQGRFLAIRSLARLGATDALRRLAADPRTDHETRAFVRASTRPLRVPKLLATTAGVAPD